jgi:hypothetical protein
MTTVYNSNIGKSDTDNLPAPTDLSENPYGRKPFFSRFGVSQKSASVVLGGITVELEPRKPIFEKYFYLREKGGC